MQERTTEFKMWTKNRMHPNSLADLSHDKGREGLTNFANVIFTDQPDRTVTIPFNLSKLGHVHVTSPVRASIWLDLS